MADNTEPRVEEIDSDDEEVPVVEEVEVAPEEAQWSRGEKKARKAIEKLGMKTITDVTRVTMKKSKNMLFVIEKPDVYKSAICDTYMIFGEAKLADTSGRNRAQQPPANPLSAPDVAKAPTAAPSSATTNTTAGNDEPVDETGVEGKDIELVMGQAGCSRAAAVRALKSNDNDIVNAIMELTM